MNNAMKPLGLVSQPERHGNRGALTDKSPQMTTRALALNSRFGHDHRGQLASDDPAAYPELLHGHGEAAASLASGDGARRNRLRGLIAPTR